MLKRGWIFLVLFVFGIMIYANGLNNKFLWDDNFILSRPDMSQTKFIFSQWDPYNVKYFSGYYRPLAHMVYAFCYDTFKHNYWQYHLLNLFLFVLLSFLIYLLVEQLAGNYHLALLTSVLFLIHPINGIMVNNIVASALTIQVIFILAVFLFLWGALESNNDRILYSLSLFFSFLSLFWYDMGVLIPIYLTPVILIFRKDRLKTKIIYLLPFFYISFSYLLFRHFFLNGTPFSINLATFHMSVWEYAATLLRLIDWYIVKLIFLQGIVLQWVIPVVREHLLEYCLGGFALFTAFLFLFIRYSGERIIRLAIVWILIGFAPLGLMAFLNPDVGAVIEPHWFIFSSMGFFILASYFFLFIIQRTAVAGWVLLFFVIFSCGATSRAYNQVWADGKTYALYWSRVLPKTRFIDGILANAYLNEGDLNESEKFDRLSNHGVSISAGASNNIGVIELGKGHLKIAEEDFNLVLMIDPKFANAYQNLGIIYLEQGKLEKAKRYFIQALNYDPYLLAPRRGLAVIALDHSQFQEAIAFCLKNLDIKGNDPDTLMLLVGISFRQKDPVALKKYAYLLINNENDPSILTQLGAFLVVNNIVDVAKDCYTKVLRVAPDYKNAYLDEGTLFMDMGPYTQAIRVWQQGEGLYPSEQRFKEHIAKALAMEVKMIGI